MKRFNLLKKQSGFTLIELLVVMVVIGILSTITYVGAGAVVAQSKKDEIRTVLTGSRQKIDDYKKKEGSYPKYNQLPAGTVPDSYEGNYIYSSSYSWCGNGQCYCLEITDLVGFWPSTQSVNYHISSINNDPLPGDCNGFQQEALGNGFDGETVTGSSEYGTIEIEGKTPLKGRVSFNKNSLPQGYVGTAQVRVAAYRDGTFYSASYLYQYNSYVCCGGTGVGWYIGSVDYSVPVVLKAEWNDPANGWSELISVAVP